jgi:hypothetical protein
MEEINVPVPFSLSRFSLSALVRSMLLAIGRVLSLIIARA